MLPPRSAPKFPINASTREQMAQGGVWPLDLHDSVDDYDGVGLVNATRAEFVLLSSSERDGSSTAATYGHDYGYASASSIPNFTYFGDTYNVRVQPGDTVRAAAIMMSDPSCGSTPISRNNCSTNPYPSFCLVLDGSGVWETSCQFDQNYQYVSYTNTTGSVQFIDLRFWMNSWNGLGGTSWGVAWDGN